MASLVKKLEESVVAHEDKELKVFVNLLGEDRDALDADAKKFAEEHEIKAVPIVVPVEFENGPDNYGINPDAEVTVMMYSGGEVKFNHAFAPEALNEEAVETVAADVPMLLEE